VVGEPDLAAENARLRAANAKLRQVVDRQTVELDAARARIGEQAARIEALAARIEALSGLVEQLQARLGQNSRNSSMPPSAEGLRKKPAQPRQRGLRKPGKQPGSQGKHLAQTADPDEVVVHVPKRCEGCGGGLEDAPVVGHNVRQVFDLPPIRLVTTEHRAQHRRCSCGRITAAVFPAHVTAPACYGPGLKALIAYLSVYQHLPTDRTAQLLADVFDAPVATGTIAAVLAEAAGRAAPAVEAIREQLATAEVACFDETGVRVAGRGHWLHCACTEALSYYTVHPKRGVAAMDDAGVLPGFAGVAVHDCWRPYWHYDVTHSLCNAHLVRELTGIAEQGGDQDWAEFLIDTLLCAKAWADQARTAGVDAVPTDRIAAIRARYHGHLAQGRQANPIMTGQRRQSKAANLLDRLDRHCEEVLRFLTDLRVPFTNNLGERDIRMAKLQTKISGGWRTLAGAQAFCKVRSYIATARKQGINALGALRDAFVGNPWIPPATRPPPDLAAAA
jgi:transposase